MRKFHVSYYYQTQNQTGFGSITITSNVGKLSENLLKESREYIMDLNKLDKVVILNCIKLAR